MRSPLTGTDVETTALARTFFLGLLEPGEQADVLAAIITRTEQDLRNLQVLARRLDAVGSAADPVFRHQRATLDYGIGAHEFALEWFRGHASAAAGQRRAVPPSSIR